MSDDFVWPSDRARAENSELNRVCEELNRVCEELDDVLEDLDDVLEDLVSAETQLSEFPRSIEAQETIKGMVEYCLNRGIAMGMKEGMDLDTYEPMPFRVELEAWVGGN